jgi:ribose/xylose/arabinose/galactoside ABC-type transport system permease subunit
MRVNENLSENNKRFNFKRILSTEFYLFLFIVIILILLFFTTKGFFGLGNIMSIANTFSFLLIGAIGMNLIILISDIDVSAGALISVVCIIIAAIGKLGANVLVLILVAIISGMALGLVNALLVVKVRIPSIVATLATSLLFAGVLPLVCEGSIYNLPPSFTWLSFHAKLFGFIPSSVIIMLVITVSFILFMNYSKFSKKVYAVGNNRNGAKLSGINNDKIEILCFVIAGALFGITAVIIATGSQRVTTTMGSGLAMKLIASVAVGGTSISGGRGKLIGTVFGTFILSIISPAINYLGISSNWADAIMGAIFIISVVISEINFVSNRKIKIKKLASDTGGQLK